MDHSGSTMKFIHSMHNANFFLADMQNSNLRIYLFATSITEHHS